MAFDLKEKYILDLEKKLEVMLPILERLNKKQIGSYFMHDHK